MGCRHPIGDRPILLGRSDECDVRIADRSVSRKHATVEPTPEGNVVRDLGSTNGTFVNDRRLVAPCPLRDGDYVQMGDRVYRYLAGGNVEAAYHEEIYRLSVLDPLTGAHNQRHLTEFLEREVARSQRHARPLSVLMIDIDRFKAVNDTHGHPCGDSVLRGLASCVRGSVRREDLFARYGGEEFALVLVETPHPQAVHVAERLRELIADHVFWFESAPLRVTVSVGVATTEGTSEVSATDLIKLADERLYQAKQAGRNCVVGAARVPETDPAGVISSPAPCQGDQGRA
jgi:diguanylate cyclase (GGDEF)-like protein